MKEFIGEMTDFEYYDWALSPEEVRQLYHNKITPDELRTKQSQENIKK